MVAANLAVTFSVHLHSPDDTCLVLYPHIDPLHPIGVVRLVHWTSNADALGFFGQNAAPLGALVAALSDEGGERGSLPERARPTAGDDGDAARGEQLVARSGS